MKTFVLFVAATLTLCSCSWIKKKALLAPAVPPVYSVVQDRRLDELSGIAVSPDQPGVLFVHNDSGDSSRFFAIGPDGVLKAIFHFRGEPSVRLGVRDVEDIAIGPGPDSGAVYIYLGDIGDNNAERGFVTVYRIKEPVVDGGADRGAAGSAAAGSSGSATSAAGASGSVSSGTGAAGSAGSATSADSAGLATSAGSARSAGSVADKPDVPHFEVTADPLYLKYPDGARDAETLMVDPLLRQLYIVSKREDAVHVYSTPLDFSPRVTRTLVRHTKLRFPGLDKWITAGDISQKGDQILIKSYTGVFYWRRKFSRTGSNAAGRSSGSWGARGGVAGDSAAGDGVTGDAAAGNRAADNGIAGNVTASKRAAADSVPEPVWMTLQRPWTLQPYMPERQGEAIAFSADEKGFYTVSEGRRPKLYYYPLVDSGTKRP